MTNAAARHVILAGAIAFAAVAATGIVRTTAAAQSYAATAASRAAAGAWVAPRTPDGHPDIHGVWANNTVTPLERPKQWEGKERLTDADIADLQKFAAQIVENDGDAQFGDGFILAVLNRIANPKSYDPGTGNYNQFWLVERDWHDRRTSLIVDPPNGRLPEMTAEGKRLGAMMKSSWALPGETGQTWDAPEDFDSWDRCITRGMPSSMMPYRYNNGLRIMQAPGYVVLDLEMIHESRIVPLDGRPMIAKNILHYMGESRGRWEGNTLVVETTNYHPGPSATNIGVAGSPGGNRVPVSPQMKTTERFTRLNNDMMLYEIKTEDPVVWTRPWTVRYPLLNQPKYDWWEYACHEGNSVIPNYVSASRAERAKAAAEKANGGAAPAQPAGRGGRQ